MSSHFSEKASKGSFLKPDNVQNHSNEGQGKKKERGEDKKAMVALLVFIMARAIMALYNGYFGRKKLLDGKNEVHLMGLTFLKNRLEESAKINSFDAK